jgi:hypothetical protein
VSLERANSIDAALLMMEPSVINANSYKIWGPIGVDPFESFLPFATTAEIDALLFTNTRCYSTGRTTGPKGFGNNIFDTACNLRVVGINGSRTITDPALGALDYTDLLIFSFENSPLAPAAGGDSGSALVALIDGTYKIIGIVIAAGTGMTASQGFACRIDQFAQELNVRAWNGTLSKNTAGGDDARNEMLISQTDPRAGVTSFIHNGHTYWQAGFRLPLIPPGSSNSSASSTPPSSSNGSASSTPPSSSNSTVSINSSNSISSALGSDSSSDSSAAQSSSLEVSSRTSSASSLNYKLHGA